MEWMIFNMSDKYDDLKVGSTWISKDYTNKIKIIDIYQDIVLQHRQIVSVVEIINNEDQKYIYKLYADTVLNNYKLCEEYWDDIVPDDDDDF